MYRHAAESIKETSSLNFISQIEKDKFNNYENIMRSVDDSYNKEEVDNKIKELSDDTYGNVESSYVSESNTIDGYVKDLEILGNTIQNEDDLADIKSVGELQEDGTYKMSIISCGKNLFDGILDQGTISNTTGTDVNVSNESRARNFIKVPESRIITISRDITTSTLALRFFDENYNFIIEDYNKWVLNSNNANKTFILPEYVKYFRFKSMNPDLTVKYQIEEGTLATSYEPYKESRVDINLPCQLEKIGAISDRLYYDEEEKAWCIEKYIGEIVLNGTENWWIEPSSIIGDRTKFVCETFIDTLPPLSDVCITNKYIFNNDGPYDSCRISPSMKRMVFNTNTSNNITDFKEKLSKDNIIVKYATSTTQKIILPLDVQIQLNSYANKTHIYIVSGEVDGTIKATLPKSLCASVQTLNEKTDVMNTRLESIEKLKEGQNLSYESDKGFVLCENTDNGQIDNLKIEGKTLVNLLIDSSNDTISTVNGINKEYRYLEGGKTYTAVTFVIENNNNKAFHPFRVTYSDNLFIGSPKEAHKSGTITTFKFTLEDKDIKVVWVNWCSEYIEGDIITTKTLLLEGDHTSNYPSHFEGLMSVGGDVDEIEIISRKDDGNIMSPYFWRYGIIRDADGTYGNTTEYACTHLIRVCPNTTYGFYGYTRRIYYYDNLKNYITRFDIGNGTGQLQKNTFTTPNNCHYIALRVDLHWEYSAIKSLKELQTFNTMIYKTNTLSSNTEIHKSHTKSLIYYNDLGELVPVPELHEWDIIEKHSDGKYYYHKRSEKIVLNGSEEWVISNSYNTNTNQTDIIRLRTVISEIKIDHTEIHSISDKFMSVPNTKWQELTEHIETDKSNYLSITISVNKLNTPDVTGFKSWLASNNVTVVYELAEEQVYECVNLNLDTYDNETMIMCNTGAITPKLSFNISSHIGNTISILRERLKQIEESFTEDKISQNTFQLNTLYASDKLVFNVNIYAYSVNEYDEDLFTLISEVLLSCKYNLTKMEEIIDFYTMIGRLSFDMADVLFEMIENQINPPVIEIPEEEIELLPEI